MGVTVWESVKRDAAMKLARPSGMRVAAFVFSYGSPRRVYRGQLDDEPPVGDGARGERLVLDSVPMLRGGAAELQ